MKPQGLFITFEGPEGAGKTTHIQHLSADLAQAGYPVRVTREPGGTPISEQIREMLLNPNHPEMGSTTELLLVAAARSQHVLEFITKVLAEHKIVICSRFADATVAYQGYGRRLDLDVIRHLNRIATNGLTPHLTFLLDLPVEIGLQRVQQSRGEMDRLELEDIEFHRRVRQGYLAMASHEPNRVKVIDAQASADRVYEQIKAEVDRRIKVGIRE
jgi:dTMP kinase